MAEEIPVIDLQELVSPDRVTLAGKLVDAFHNIGFAYLVNHGVCQNTIEQAFSACKLFFERPVQEKLVFRRKNATEGYHGAYSLEDGGVEDVDDKPPTFDFRESFDFFGNVDFDNVSRSGVDADFIASMQTLQNACSPLCIYLFELLGIGLGLGESYFIARSTWLRDPGNPSFKTFRALYYPAISEDIVIPAGQARVKEHSDHGFVTLLFQDSVGGLEVKDSQGNWKRADPLPGSILVNIGDLLEFWSGGFLKATKHRVLIPDEEIRRRTSRQSIVYFLHPNAATVLTPFKKSSICRYDDDFEEISAGDFATAKLAGVKSY